MAFPNALLVEQSNSPSMREDFNYKYITRIFAVTGRQTEAQLKQGEYLPAVGSKDSETDALYMGYEYESSVGYPTVKLQYRYRFLRDAIYEAHDASYEAPIEKHTDFLMKWKYNLLGKVAKGTSSVPAFAATATDYSDLITNDGYTWTTETIKGDYKYLWQAAEKLGVNNFLRSAVVVTKRKVYDEQSLAEAWIAQSGSLQKPVNNFGFTSSTYENWLIRDVRLADDDGWYAVSVEYLYNPDKWDSDIYTEADFEDDGL